MHQILFSRDFREELKAKVWGGFVLERLYKGLVDYHAAATPEYFGWLKELRPYCRSRQLSLTSPPLPISLCICGHRVIIRPAQEEV